MGRRFEILSFEYAITRPLNEHWRYVNLVLMLFGLVTFAVFMTINAYLVGYDVITVNQEDYNASQSLPWLAAWKSESKCEEHTFKLGDMFRTNVSVFPYTIFNIIGDSGMSGGFDYANNILNGCNVKQEAVMVSPGDRALTLTAEIGCPAPLNFEASTTWTYSNHAMLGTITSDLFGINTIPRALFDGLSNFGGEAYEGIYNGKYVATAASLDGERIRDVIIQADPDCTTTDASCPRPHVNVTFINAIGQTDLQILANSDLDASTNISSDTLYNILEVFYHAIRLDLGIWTPDNIYTNTTAFNTSLSQYVSSGIPNYGAIAFREMANTKGMLYANATSSTANTSTPNAVIRMTYTCNNLKRKSAASWFISVLSATLSMFLAAWGLAIATCSWLARRSSGANQCSGHRNLTSDFMNLQGLNAEDDEMQLLPRERQGYAKPDS